MTDKNNDEEKEKNRDSEQHRGMEKEREGSGDLQRDGGSWGVEGSGNSTERLREDRGTGRRTGKVGYRSKKKTHNDSEQDRVTEREKQKPKEGGRGEDKGRE